VVARPMPPAAPTMHTLRCLFAVISLPGDAKDPNIGA
jgi:hypothetical protein